VGSSSRRGRRSAVSCTRSALLTPAAARATDGTARAFVRTDDSGALASVRAAPALGWQVPARLPNPGGMAAPVVVTRDGRAGPEFLLFVRNSNGGVSATSQPGDGADWTDLGGHLLSQPAAVRAPNGSIMLLAIGADGNLVTDESDPDAAHGLAFHGWQPAIS